MKQLFIFMLALSFFAPAQGQDSTVTQKPRKEIVLYEITQLTEKAESDKYGLTGAFPVKVGRGAKGGPSNQRAYLDLLRDEQGNPVEYKRVGGACCPYKSENATLGNYALVDTYEVSYKNKKGKNKKVLIYISFYDYENPKIPVGFLSDDIE